MRIPVLVGLALVLAATAGRAADLREPYLPPAQGAPPAAYGPAPDDEPEDEGPAAYGPQRPFADGGRRGEAGPPRDHGRWRESRWHEGRWYRRRHDGDCWWRPTPWGPERVCR